jgi:hypothetical protein
MTIGVLTILFNRHDKIIHKVKHSIEVERVRRQAAQEAKRGIVLDQRGRAASPSAAAQAVVDNVCHLGLPAEEQDPKLIQFFTLWCVHFALEVPVPPGHVIEGLSIPKGNKVTRVRDVLMAAFRDRLAQLDIEVRINTTDREGKLCVEVAGRAFAEVTKH